MSVTNDVSAQYEKKWPTQSEKEKHESECQELWPAAIKVCPPINTVCVGCVALAVLCSVQEKIIQSYGQSVICLFLSLLDNVTNDCFQFDGWSRIWDRMRKRKSIKKRI